MSIAILLCDDGHIYADAACAQNSVRAATGKYDDEIPLAVITLMAPTGDPKRIQVGLDIIKANIAETGSFMRAMDHLAGEIFRAGQEAERKRIVYAGCVSAETLAAAGIK